ncbi:MAG: 3-hydroxyacyl-CoA dehydrogenase NAD-binding domain-containing protein [Vulcanimicrobiaceae bacterium]
MDERIIIVGGGTMGAGIAAVAARAGFSVDLVEPDAAAAERAKQRLAREAARDADAWAGAVVLHDAVPESSDAILGLEAVVESAQVKAEVLGALAKALPADAVLATNTSSLSVDELAQFVDRPERFLGLHFFNPPTVMELVEIVPASGTSDAALARARELIARLGKTSVQASDTPGFIVNRVARPYYLQSMHALDEGVGAVEELDALARGVGFRMGPFELMDLIGLDVSLATSESIYERTGAARLEPVALQRTMVADGRLGRKTGHGFYDYADGSAPRVDDSLLAEPQTRNEDESVVIIGAGGLADDLAERLAEPFANVTRLESEEFLNELSAAATIVIDVGDGTMDRSRVLRELDGLLAPECVIFADAYATDLDVTASALKHPERLVGYGILGSLERQRVVEVVDLERVSDDALALAQEVFESLRRRVVLVENAPGLFLGRTVASIVNEAVIAVHEDVASTDDIDVAMRLGTNYPIGPIAWGREIGGARIARILHRLADARGPAFAPHRALWVLDIDEDGEDALELDRPVL